MKKKSGIIKSGLDAMLLFLQDDLLSNQMEIENLLIDITSDWLVVKLQMKVTLKSKHLTTHLEVFVMMVLELWKLM